MSLEIRNGKLNFGKDKLVIDGGTITITPDGDPRHKIIFDLLSELFDETMNGPRIEFNMKTGEVLDTTLALIGQAVPRNVRRRTPRGDGEVGEQR